MSGREWIMQLSDLIGNHELKASLQATMDQHRLPHALMIEGAAGTGKKMLAQILAQYCLCSAQEHQPCGKCLNCQKAEKGVHPDLMIYDGEQQGALNIESIRNIRSSAYIMPNEAPRKVYILHHCEKMLPAAQNAFLKVMEEPPDHVVFILTTETASAMLETVQSRARVITLYPPDPSETAEWLRERMPDHPIEEIREAAEACGGNIGMTMAMLQTGGDEGRKLAKEIFHAIPLSTEYPLLLLTYRLTESRAFAMKVLDDLGELAAECVKASVGVQEVSEDALDTARRLSLRRLLHIQKTIMKARDILNINVNLNFYSTWLCAALRSD